MKLIIAEKPIAAKRIAGILGKPKSKKISSIEVFELEGSVVVPLKGHVLDVDFPKDMNNWQKTELSDLIDGDIKYSASLAGIKKALHSYSNADELIIASVDYSEITPVIYPDGMLRLVKIGEFIDGVLEREEDPSGYKVPCFDRNFKFNFKKIKKVIRHKINEPLYDIKLEYGKRVKITSSHSVFTFKNGKVELIKGSDIKKEDLIIAPSSLPKSKIDVKSIDLLEYIVLNKQKVCRGVYVNGESVKSIFLKKAMMPRTGKGLKFDNRVLISKKLQNELKKRRESLKLSQSYIAKKIKVSQTMVSVWEGGLINPTIMNCKRYFNFLGFSLDKCVKQGLCKILPSIVDERIKQSFGEQWKGSRRGIAYDYKSSNLISALDLSKLSDDVLLSPSKHRHNSVSRKILVSKDLLALIGFYIAEGSLNGGYKVRFHFGPLGHGRERKNVEEVVRAVENVFGIKPFVRKTKTGTNIEIDNYLVWLLFAEIFGFKQTNSLTKDIPSIVFNTTYENQKAFLRALFLGDGSLGRSNITFNTISSKLANSLQYLLLQQGLNASYSTSEPQSSESAVIRSKHKIHRVTICSKPDLAIAREIWNDHHKACVIKKYLNNTRKGYKKMTRINDLCAVKVKGIKKTQPNVEYVYDFSVEGQNFICGIGGVCCHNTDFDREGESIGKEAIDIVREKNPKIKVKRAKFSALTPSEVKKAFDSLAEFDYNLADAADSRREIDLIWGAVLTRYVSLTSGKLGRNFLSVGRVQTPALAIVVEREKEIQAFKPRDFWTLTIECEKNKEKFTATFEEEKIFDGKKADKIASVNSKEAFVKKVEKKKFVSKPPTPFNTTEFMRAASNLGVQPKRAMGIAEKLYMDGLTSYPRTDNTHYPDSLDLREVLRKFSETKEFGELAKKLLAKKKLNPTHGKKKTTDHPPIYPVEPADRKKLKDADWKIYELIVRRFMGTLSDDSESESVKAILDYSGADFIATGKTVLFKGWREFYPYSKSEEQYLPELSEKEKVKASGINSEKKQTKPKPRYSAAALIKLMDDLNLGTKCLSGDTSVKLINNHSAFDVKLNSLFEKNKKIKKKNIELAVNSDYSCISMDKDKIVYPNFSFVSKRKLDSNEKMYKVVFSDGVRVKATNDHPFYVFGNGGFLYKKTEDLRKGDKVVSVSRPDKVGKTLIEWTDFLKTCNKETSIFSNEGKKIKSIRKKLKLSQKKFAEKFGFSQGNLANYESGKRDVPLWVLKKFDILPDEICGVNKKLILKNPFPLHSCSSLARIAANLWADGSLDVEKLKRENCYDFRYTNTNLDLLQRFADDINFIFGYKPRISLNKNKLKNVKNKPVYHIRLPSLIGRLICPVFINPDKFVKKSFYPEFIGAFFDDEGHAYKNEKKIFISNTDISYLKLLKRMLEYLDIDSVIDIKQSKLFIRKEKSIQKFLEKIPIASVDKKQRIISMLSRKFKPRGGCSGISICSKEKKILSQLSLGWLTSKEISKSTGLKKSSVIQYLRNLNKKGLIKRKILSKNHTLDRNIVYTLKKPFPDSYYSLIGETVIAPDIITKTVIDSEPINYEGFVYDLTVDPRTPNFTLSNGVVVHNSTRAEILQKLIDRGYIQGTNSFTPSSIGFAVVDTLGKYSEDITKPKMTADLEKEMDEVEQGKISKVKVVGDSRVMLHSVLKKLEKNKQSIGEKLKSASFDDYIVGKCPECGGRLRMIRTRRGTRFVGCSGYKDGCRVSFPLPAKGMIQPLNTECKECGLPMIRVINKGRRPYEMCVNHKCKSKENWGKKKKKE